MEHYLFFDLEFASSDRGNYRVCEFGYVMTDETLEILEKGDFPIDPAIDDGEWDDFVTHHILTKPKETYVNAPQFDQVHDRILTLFREADLVFGHTVDGDAAALNQECRRFYLKSIDYDFYDLKRVYRRYSGESHDVSVTNILLEMEIPVVGKEHDAGDDADNTMRILKGLVGKTGKSVREILLDYPEAKGRSENYAVESYHEETAPKDPEEEKPRNTLAGRYGSLLDQLLLDLDEDKS